MVMFSLSEGMHQMLIIFIVAPLAPACCFGCRLVESACVCIDAESEVVVAGHGCEDCDLSPVCLCDVECAHCGDGMDSEWIDIQSDNPFTDGLLCRRCGYAESVDCSDCRDSGERGCGPDTELCHCQPTVEEMRAEERFDRMRDGW